MPHYPQSSAIRKLFRNGQPLVFGKGDILLGNEPEPNGVYYIESGYIKIYTISDDGDELLHIIYGQGELFPLIWAYIGVQPGLLLYEALSTTTVWRIARDWFNYFAHKDAEIGYAMATQMAQQFRVYSERVDNLEYKKATERVAYRLLYLAGRFGVQESGSIIIDAPITHEAFANSINLARESVSRVLEKFEHEGLLRRSGPRMVLIDAGVLATKLSRDVDLRHWRLDAAPPHFSSLLLQPDVPATFRAPRIPKSRQRRTTKLRLPRQPAPLKRPHIVT